MPQCHEEIVISVILIPIGRIQQTRSNCVPCNYYYIFIVHIDRISVVIVYLWNQNINEIHAARCSMILSKQLEKIQQLIIYINMLLTCYIWSQWSFSLCKKISIIIIVLFYQSITLWICTSHTFAFSNSFLLKLSKVDC